MNTDTATASPLRAVGFNDEQTHCDRCGRLELRGTVILADDDNLEAGRYGTSCAAKMIAASTGRPVKRLTRSDAQRAELFRADSVQRYLRAAVAALNADDPAIAQLEISAMRRDPAAVPHLPAELDIIARVDATGYYIPRGNTTADAVRRNYTMRVQAGKKFLFTSLAAGEDFIAATARVNA